MSNRRGFLRLTLGSAWTGAALLEQAVFRAAAARAQSNSSDLPKLFNIEKLAEGIYAAIAKPAALINCNAVIFEQDRDIMIVDTHSKPSAAISLLSQIRREVSPKPVKYIVNSHFHWDHTQGNGAYRRIAPNADVVSSEVTRQLLSENGAKRMKDSVGQAEKALAGYRESMAKASTPEAKAYFTEVVASTRDYISEMSSFKLELPNVTLKDDLIIHDKAHDLHLAFRGRGHTAGDVVVFCPQKKVVATGDLLHGFAPFIADGYPLSWPRTLLTVASFGFDHVVGGHGGVQHSKQVLNQMAAYIEDATELVANGKRSGKSADILQREIRAADLKSLTGDGYGAFLAGSIKRYRSLPPGMTEREILDAAVASNIGDIYAALDRG